MLIVLEYAHDEIAYISLSMGTLAMARKHPDIKPATPGAAITLMLLSIVCFIIGLWAIMALTRIVLG